MSEELHLNIQSLHDILEDSPVDECTAGSLKQITDEIKIAVAQAEGDIPIQGYNEQLEQEAIRFSEDHPALTEAIRQLMITLSSMGI
ncbi:DUF4404 family protein [Endozoicomonas elysicola]|uniref:Chromosome partitioning protein ParA n=1 Tax=Endozoicomonas elysicola TaxID=305900 RepID=A0A081K5N5_9GAMM|nr:DUF4404 family protein [Endozoicomonas elysicola]KEI69461.1 hypothetical protein GV64_00770 [Endozoicomonas elysicola]